VSSRQGEKRVVNSAEDLLLYTDLDESEYPIYLTSEREVWIKAKPKIVEAVEDHVKRVRWLPVLATFFVKNVTEVSDGVSHPLLERAVTLVREVTKKDPQVLGLEVVYEVYRGEDQALGEAKAYVVKVLSCEAPFSNVKFKAEKAWAIGYGWKKRIVAREPSLSKYVYVVGSGNELRASVRVLVKLPVVTREFEALFARASGATAAGNVDQAIEELEKLVAERERELAELKAKLEELRRLKSLPGRIASLAPVELGRAREKAEAGVGA
jgi:hypothetical protein